MTLKKSQKAPPRALNYMDYRSFLKDRVTYMLSMGKPYSIRMINKRAGFNSPSYLQSILQGKRNLTHSAAVGLARALNLEPQEKGYLNILIDFVHAKDEGAQRKSRVKLTEYQALNSYSPLKETQSAFLSRWYYPAIYCLIGSSHKISSANDLVNLLQPQISVADAQTGLDLLEKIQMIEFCTNEGRWKTTSTSVTAQGALPKEAFQNFHAQCLEVAQKLLETTPTQWREFNATQITLKPEKLPEIKAFLIDVRRRFRALFDDPEGTLLVHLETALFPLSRLPGNGDS